MPLHLLQHTDIQIRRDFREFVDQPRIGMIQQMVSDALAKLLVRRSQYQGQRHIVYCTHSVESGRQPALSIGKEVRKSGSGTGGIPSVVSTRRNSYPVTRTVTASGTHSLEHV